MTRVNFEFPEFLVEIWKARMGEEPPKKLDNINLDELIACIPFSIDLSTLRSDKETRRLIQGTLAMCLGISSDAAKTLSMNKCLVILGVLSRSRLQLVNQSAARMSERISKGGSDRLVTHDEAEDAMGSLQQGTDTLRSDTKQGFGSLRNECQKESQSVRRRVGEAAEKAENIGGMWEAFKEQQVLQQQQQDNIIQQLTQQQQDQQDQNTALFQSISQQQQVHQEQQAAVIQGIMQELAGLKKRSTTTQQGPVAVPQAPKTEEEEATQEVTDPSAARDVKRWAAVMSSGRTEALVHGIRERYVNSLEYKVGGSQLLSYFKQLKNFILGFEYVVAWEENPHFVELGNDLLEQLRIQHYFCKDGTKRSELEMIMKVASEDPLEKANAIAKRNKHVKLQQPKWKGGKASVSTYPASGNGRGFAK